MIVIQANQTSNLTASSVSTSATSISVGMMLPANRDQRVHAARAALDVARHAAGLPLQVEAQAQRMQVPEHLQRDAACRTLGGLAKISPAARRTVDSRSRP